MRRLLERNIEEATSYLLSKGVKSPEIGIILGTGLNRFADRLENTIRIPYSEIPYFHTGQVEGHYGEVLYGKYQGKNVIIMAGRFHFYEGHSMDRAAITTRTMINLGINRLIITNAAGCVNLNWSAGDLMLISDHINLSGDNPLIGPNLDKYGPRFPDMTDTYNKELRAKLKRKAIENGIYLQEGVYTMMAGPSFETPAEIRMIRAIGGDAVGMSSVPEAIVANHAGLEIIGISLMSNMAAGILENPITSDEVDQKGREVQAKFSKVLDMAINI